MRQIMPHRTDLITGFARYIIPLLPLVLMVACIPAQLPPQLAYTPGPAAVIEADFVEMPSGYRVPRPAHWDAQLNAADAPEALTLIAPDKGAVIIISTHQNYPFPDIPTIPAESQIVVSRETAISGSQLYLWLITTSDYLDLHLETLSRLRENISA
jgi:hypothetical protein